MPRLSSREVSGTFGPTWNLFLNLRKTLGWFKLSFFAHCVSSSFSCGPIITPRCMFVQILSVLAASYSHRLMFCDICEEPALSPARPLLICPIRFGKRHTSVVFRRYAEFPFASLLTVPRFDLKTVFAVMPPQSGGVHLRDKAAGSDKSS